MQTIDQVTDVILDIAVMQVLSAAVPGIDDLFEVLNAGHNRVVLRQGAMPEVIDFADFEIADAAMDFSFGMSGSARGNGAHNGYYNGYNGYNGRGGGRGGRTKKGGKTKTLGELFKRDLQKLVDSINATKPKYVRCIKPNDEKKPCRRFSDRVQSGWQ